ncbi:unnamed protein product [Arctogadus glacialis]
MTLLHRHRWRQHVFVIFAIRCPKPSSTYYAREIWRYLVRSGSAFKSQMWRLQGYLTEKTLKSHLSFIEWTHWFANDHKDAPIGRLLHGIHHLFKW